MRANNISDIQFLDALSRQDLSVFTRKTFEIIDPTAKYLHNWHIELIAKYLEACKKGDIKRLIINIPPRHLKSISVAVAFPAWLLGHNPSEQVICASYSQDLAFKHSIDCRAVIESEWYKRVFPNVELVKDQNTKSKFMTTERGFRFATSVGGTVTGEGANFLIVDDPLSAMQAHSEAMRETSNRWFDQAFMTRLNNKKDGCVIVVMQRLHDNDLTGHLLAKEGWEHLCLPVVATQDENFVIGGKQFKRKEGDLLHSERMGHEEIEREKIAIGSYAFAGQYQQTPSPEGGGEFRKEWIQFYEGVLDHSKMNKYIFIDPANSKKRGSDYTAAIVLGVHDDGNLYVLDMIRDKLDVRERENLVFDLHKKYNPLCVYYEKYGMQADIDYLKKAQEEKNYRFKLQEVGGSLNKEDRIRRLIPYFFDNKIYLPRQLYKTNYENKVIDVTDEFIHQEYVAFPVGLHDDLLDALARLADVKLIYPSKNRSVNYHGLYGFMDSRKPS